MTSPAALAGVEPVTREIVDLANELVGRIWGHFTARAAELIALDDALDGLAQVDQRKARVIELRFFGGLTVDEAALVLKISPQSVMRDWKLARAWLMRELRR